MRKLTLKTATLFFISILLASTACQKKSDFVVENIPSLQNKVEEAKTWFANGPVLREKEMLNLPYNVLPEKSPKRVFARMGKMQARLQWENAEHYNRNGLSYLIIPVSFNSKIFGNDYDFAKAVIFNKTSSGEMKANVMEILSKKGTSLGGRQMEIAATAFYNRELNKKELLAGLNASVFFYDEMYKKQNGFEVINGEWAATKTTLVVGKNMQSAANSNYRATECELWGCFVDHYDANGVLLYSTLLYTYYVGDCDDDGPGDDPTESGDPNGSGGGSGGGGGNEFENGINQFKLNYEINSVSENESSQLLSETTETRTKKYLWICGRGVLIQAKSLEYGTHKKVNNEWQWETLAHQSVDITGVVVGGSVSVTSHSGQPTIGIYHAAMDVNYTLQYNAIIPGFSPINWSVTKSAATIWNVNY